MKIAAIREGKYSGVVYEQFNGAIFAHHTGYGEIFGEVKRDVVENDVPTAQEILDAMWLIHKRFQVAKIDAEGMLGMYDKANKGGVKATANLQWVDDFWNNVYYPKRQAVLAETATLDPTLYDFSSYPEMPYNYYEAKSE